MANQFTCLPCACKTWIYFLLDYYIFCAAMVCVCVFNLRLSIITTWWFFWLLLGEEGSTLEEHLAITSRVSSTTPTLCGNLLSFPLIAGHLWLLSIADVIGRAILSSANDLTLSSSAAEDTPTRHKSCPNETVVTDEKSSLKATPQKIQDGGGPSKKKRSSSGSHTKLLVSCSLTHRHQTQTRSHPHIPTDQLPSTSSDVPANFSQFAEPMYKCAEVAVGNSDLFDSEHTSKGQYHRQGLQCLPGQDRPQRFGFLVLSLPQLNCPARPWTPAAGGIAR